MDYGEMEEYIEYDVEYSLLFWVWLNKGEMLLYEEDWWYSVN